MKVAGHVRITRNRKLVLFLQHIKEKSIATAFVFHCVAKHSDILRGSSRVRCYLILGGCGQKWAHHFRLWSSKTW